MVMYIVQCVVYFFTISLVMLEQLFQGYYNYRCQFYNVITSFVVSYNII